MIGSPNSRAWIIEKPFDRAHRASYNPNNTVLSLIHHAARWLPLPC